MTQQPPQDGTNHNYPPPQYGPPQQQPYGQQPQGNPHAQPYGQAPGQPYGQQPMAPYGQPYAGYPGALAPKAPLSQLARNLGWVAVAAAILAIIGCFGAWITVDAGIFHLSMNGFGQVSGAAGESAGEVKDGVVVTILAVVVIVFGVVRGLGKISLAAGIVTLVMGLLSLATTIYDVGDVSDNLSGASVGWGLWLCLLMSIAISTVGVVEIVKRK